MGGFTRPADGTLGGQLFACTSLLDSPLRDRVVWHLVDSSQRSLPPPPIWIRAWDALRRVVKACCLLTRRDVKAGLVFTSFRPFSLLEKMFICGWGGLWRKRMVVTYRSEIRSFGKLDWLMRPFLRGCLRFTSVVICQSQLAADRFAKFFPKHQHKVIVIPNWIDATPYEEAVARRIAARTEQSDLPGEPIFLFLGWLEENKGVHDLLEAVRQLGEAGQRFRVRIGGSGSEHQRLVAMAANLGIENRVEFLGWVAGPDKLQVMAGADVLVLPSYSEGMPNAVLEGMAAGLPVIATAVGGVPALVIDGKTGLLIEPGHPEQLAAAMQRLIENPAERQRLGQAGAEKIQAEHSVDQAWQKIGAALLNVDSLDA